MNRLLHYLFAALFLFGSLQVSAAICSDMNMDSSSEMSQVDDMQDCHTDQQTQKNKSHDNQKQCCDNDCVSCPQVSTSKESNDFILVSHFSEAINNQSFDTLSTFYKIITPPPIA
jgi:hypothetical protein